MRGRQRYAIDEDDDVYMYLVDIHLDDYDDYRVVIWASKATKSNRQ